jgi:hypothetical protein
MVAGVLAVMATEEVVFASVGSAALKDTEPCGGSVTKPFFVMCLHAPPGLSAMMDVELKSRHILLYSKCLKT